MFSIRPEEGAVPVAVGLQSSTVCNIQVLHKSRWWTNSHKKETGLEQVWNDALPPKKNLLSSFSWHLYSYNWEKWNWVFLATFRKTYKTSFFFFAWPETWHIKLLISCVQGCQLLPYFISFFMSVWFHFVSVQGRHTSRTQTNLFSWYRQLLTCRVQFMLTRRSGKR